MKKKNIFISFDYENDKDIKEALIAQSKDPRCPFKIIDKSIQYSIDEKWKKVARKQISNSDCVIFLCGEYTKNAPGVAAEMSITQELNIPYFLLCGRRYKKVTKPINALNSDNIYKWKWKNIKILIDNIC